MNEIGPKLLKIYNNHKNRAKLNIRRKLNSLVEIMSPRARAYAYHYTSLYQLNILRTLSEGFIFEPSKSDVNDLLPHISQNLQDNPSHNNNQNNLL